MLLQEYLAACFPSPRQLLNVDLRPFSFGHMLLLEWMENAFVTVGGQPGMDDLVTGVWVCSLSFAEAYAALRTDSIEMIERRRWRTRRRRVSVQEAFRRWRDLIGPFELKEKLADFAAYLEAGCKLPTISAVHPASSGAMPPELARVKVAMMGKLHLSEAEVMDRPWAICLWDYYTILAEEGAVKFFGGEQLEEARSTANDLKARIDAGKVRVNWETGKLEEVG